MITFDLANIEPAASLVGEKTHLDALRTHIPEYFQADVSNEFSKGGKLPFKTAVFNMEQGTRLKYIIPFFQCHPALQDVDVILANELDAGMYRSGNLDTTRELGKALGMNYVYGIEFITRNAGKNGNTQGLHGNAILSRFPLHNCKIVQLPIQFDWYYMPGDSRLGTRNAIFAEAEVAPGKRVGLVSVHMENRANPQERERQMKYLLDQVEEHFGDLPVLIGGDMNTNTVSGNTPGSMEYLEEHPQEQVRRLGDIPNIEPLMNHAANRGYSYTDCNIMEKITRRKPMESGATVELNLDWFFQKGLKCSRPERVETIFRMADLVQPPAEVADFEGKELSDHDAVTIWTEL